MAEAGYWARGFPGGIKQDRTKMKDYMYKLWYVHVSEVMVSQSKTLAKCLNFKWHVALYFGVQYLQYPMHSSDVQNLKILLFIT